MISCLHILLKHNKSRNPIDRFRGKTVTRSEKDALEIIKSVYDKLKEENLSKEAFEKLAYEYSECSSAENGGDLGEFGKGDMQESFEKAAYALKVDEISEPVYSDSGIHLIYRYK